MTSQELYEHVQSLARSLGVALWACLSCPGDFGMAQIDLDDPEETRMVVLTEMPDTERMYFIALHELGHHADGWGGLRLDREARAWRWALDASAVPAGPAVWARIAESLRSYAADRRYKRTEAFNALLAEAEHEGSRTYAR